MKEYGRLENIQVKLNIWRQESKDPNFTQYLNQMQNVLDKQFVSARCLEQDIDQNYRQYLQYFQAGNPIQVASGEASVGQGQVCNGKLEGIQQKLDKLRQESQDPNFTQYLEQMQTVLTNQGNSAKSLEEDINSKYAMYLQYFPRVPVQSQPKPQTFPQQMQSQTVAPRKSSVEYKIGADVFCIIGILFILIAFVMMGINYMGDLFKGVCLYIVFGGLILVSELLLRKRAEKLSHAVTGLGICGLYASTMINGTLWENFNTIVSALITVVITLLAILISRKKDSVILKVISFLGCYVSFWPASGLGSDLDFSVLTVVLFATGIVSILVPVKKHEIGIHITHLVTNTVFSLSFAYRGWYFDTDMRLCCLFLLSNILIIGLIFKALVNCVEKKKSEGIYCNATDYALLYSVMLFLQSMFFVVCVHWVKEAYLYMDLGLSSEMWGHICLSLFVVLALAFFVVFAKSTYKWIQFYAVVLMLFISYGIWGSTTSFVIANLSIFIVTKILSRIKALRVGDVAITSGTAFIALLYFNMDDWYAYAYVAAFILSVFALKHFKVFHQIMITGVVTVFVAYKMWGISLISSVIVGVLFVFLLVFNHVKFWRDKYQEVYNYINLVIMALWALLAIFEQDYLNSIIMALLGTAVIVLVFSEKYNMEFRFKYLLLAVFWTYMVFASGIKTAVIISSIIMVIAIVCVIVGFVTKQKSVRIYGLALSLLISLKIMFYDFSSTPIMERMLLFFIVGVIILSISCIYIMLEKKMANRGENI